MQSIILFLKFLETETWSGNFCIEKRIKSYGKSGENPFKTSKGVYFNGKDLATFECTYDVFLQSYKMAQAKIYSKCVEF